METRKIVIIESEKHPYREKPSPPTSIEIASQCSLQQLKDIICKTFDITGCSLSLWNCQNKEEIKEDDDVKALCSNHIVSFQAIRLDVTVDTVNIAPHYETLTNSGLYAYYDSGGFHSLYFAVGELIDNSLSATLDNDKRPNETHRDRRIEVRFYKDESRENKCAFVVMDNGHGMNRETLNQWGIYKYAKHKRIDAEKGLKLDLNPELDCIRFLNSNISKFGAGGKESAFYIGQCIRVVTKNRFDDEVLVMELSTKDFERKEREGKSVWDDIPVQKRRPGAVDASPSDSVPHAVLKDLSSLEIDKESFTYVIISDINTKHLATLQNADLCSRQLSDIYHFYIHGPNGDFTDDWDIKKRSAPKCCQRLYIDLKHYIVPRGSIVPTLVSETDLRDVHTGAQSVWIRNQSSIFEIRGNLLSEPKKKFEGILRYYHLEYDKETFPGNIYERERAEEEQERKEAENEGFISSAYKTRGNADIFTTYWNGRLIPYTTVPTLLFTTYKKGAKNEPPEECFSRLAGVLFFNDQFKVTQNKLTFQDNLNELFRLKGDDIVFEYRETNGDSGKWTKRGIDDGFRIWLNSCHKVYDKEIKFFEPGLELIHKTDERQGTLAYYPYTQFFKIQMEKKVFKKDDLFKTTTHRPFAGKILHFMLHGDFLDEAKKKQFIYGSHAYAAYKPMPCVEAFDPKKPKYIALSDVSRDATDGEIQVVVNNQSSKLPSKMVVTFEGYHKENTGAIVNADPLEEGQAITAGSEFGPFVVDILDKTKKTIKGQLSGRKKIAVSLKLFKEGNETPLAEHHTSTWSEQYKFWFDKMSCCTLVGSYRVEITSGPAVRGPNAPSIDGIHFPSKTIRFEVIPGEADYVIAPKVSGRIGVPFDIPLTFQDRFENKCTKAPTGMKASLICLDKARSFNYTVDHIVIKDDQLILKDVIGQGKITGNILVIPSELSIYSEDRSKGSERDFKPFSMDVTFKPGRPQKITVFPDTEVKIENGTLPQFGVKVFDLADNVVTRIVESDLSIQVKFYHMVRGQKKFFDDTYFLDFLTGPDGQLCHLKGGPVLKVPLQEEKEKIVYAEITAKCPDIMIQPVIREIAVVKVSKPSELRLYYSSEFNENIECELRSEETVIWTAGSFIRNIHFKMFDECGGIIEKPNLTPSNFRISWLESDWVDRHAFTAKELNARRLPDIRGPKIAGDTASFTVSFFDTSGNVSRRTTSSPNMTFTFIVKSVVGTPASLKVDCFDDNTIQAGESLLSPLVVKIVDKLDNPIADISTSDLEQLNISCETTEIVMNEVKKEFGSNPGEILVSGIRFTTTKPGEINVTFTYQDLKGRVTLEIVPGFPENLEWKLEKCAFDNTSTLPVINRCNIGTFKFELLDKYRNKCRLKGIPIHIGWHKDIHGNTSKGKVASTNESGLADFGDVNVVVKSHISKRKCPINICSGLCYGIYKVRARAHLDLLRTGVELMSPIIKIHLMCNSNRIEKVVMESDDIKDDDHFTSTAIVGKLVPSFVCRAYAEDDSVIKTMSINDIILCTKKLDSIEAVSKGVASGYDEETGAFQFIGLRAPVNSGTYHWWIEHIRPDDRTVVSSKRIEMKVVHGAPAILTNDGEPVVYAWVSNVPDRNKRLIVKNLNLRITDKYYNSIPDPNDKEDHPEYNGSITITIMKGEATDSVTNGDSSNYPRLEGDLTVPIVRGRANIESLYLAAGSPGEDLMAYTVLFMPSLPSIEDVEMKAFKLEFRFSNEGQKLEALNETRKEKLFLQKKKKEIEAQRGNLRTQFNHLKNAYDMRSVQFMNLLNDMKQHQQLVPAIDARASVEKVEKVKKIIDQKLRQLELKEERESVSNLLHPAPNEPGVLGRVAHLAQIENQQDNVVVSWILRGDMDCIVTEKFDKAKELQERLGNNQQFLSLELCRQNEWSGPLPHEKLASFKVRGNPIYARHLLQFKQSTEQQCRQIFGNLLGDTIIIDTIDDAVYYRSSLCDRGIYCPIIVTRDGKRLTSTGKFGGTANLMPHDFKVKGCLLARPPSKEYQALKAAIHDVMDLMTIARERDEAFRQMKRYEADTSAEVKQYEAEIASFTHQLNELENREKELTRKRQRADITSSFEPSLKRFC